MSDKSNDINKRRTTTLVKTAKGRKISSTHWLQRQLNDPYVVLAKQEGYRSRAAYKLLEIDQKFQILKAGLTVVDLGAAPGGWSQIACNKVITKKKDKIIGSVMAIDLNFIEPLDCLITIEGDFTEEHTQTQLSSYLPHKADLILSDMAPPSSGYPELDHIRVIGLAELALEFAHLNLAINGNFVIKIFTGAEEPKFVASLSRYFKTVKRYKPKASRAESSELYIVAKGFIS